MVYPETRLGGVDEFLRDEEVVAEVAIEDFAGFVVFTTEYG